MQKKNLVYKNTSNTNTPQPPLQLSARNEEVERFSYLA